MTKFLNIDLDTKLGDDTPSDVLVSSQKAIKTYVDTKLLEETTRAQGVEAGLNTSISTKQDKIDDLDTIVAGAAAGATAVQPSAIADMETKTNAAATYQPKGDYATKADLENVSVAVDGITITKKADGKIQASAVVNQNSGVLKSWTGTLAQYTALETKSDDTQYIITDDDSAGTNVYTKAEVDSLISSAMATADYVIEFQAPTAANGYTWYRKYKSGWVEQGGRYTNTINILTTMPVAMSDTNYSVVLTYETDSTTTPIYSSVSISTTKTTTSFTIKNAGSIYGGWQVSGMAA